MHNQFPGALCHLFEYGNVLMTSLPFFYSLVVEFHIIGVKFEFSDMEEMRRKFEEDKKKLAIARAARKFRPLWNHIDCCLFCFLSVFCLFVFELMFLINFSNSELFADLRNIQFPSHLLHEHLNGIKKENWPKSLCVSLIYIWY